MAEKHYTCKQCNTGFVASHKRAFCTEKCRWRHKTLQRNPNAILKRIRVECTCRCCGKKYIPKAANRDKYCSRACAFADRATATCRSNYKPVYTVVYWPHCKQCNKTFLSRRKDAAICSRACEVQRHRDESRAASEKKKIVKKIKCHCCGKLFTNSYGIKNNKYCSELCCKKATRASSHALRRSKIKENGLYEHVNPFKVFDRDKWKCCLCGVNTPRSKRGSYDDNAPELDHIIPLSKGGEHSYRNTQCLCRKCNSDKSDKVLGSYCCSVDSATPHIQFFSKSSLKYRPVPKFSHSQDR